MKPLSPSWKLFLLFTAVNTVLSYSTLPTLWKAVLAVAAILLPWGWALREGIPAGTKVPREGARPSRAAFLLLGAAAVAARFLHLTTLAPWPNFDESSICFDAFHLAAGWPHRFFYGISQAPPLFMWALGAWFKCVGCSLVTLKVFPSLVSLTAVPLAYAAARTQLPRSQAFLAAALIAVGFWPVFLSRFTLMTNLVLPFECLALWALGSFLRATDPARRTRAALALGTVWGLGLYTHLHWPIVVAVTFPPFALRLLKERRNASSGGARLCALALLPALVLAAPILWEAYRERYGAYLAHLWAFHPGSSGGRLLEVWRSCLTSPFWGMDPNVHTYQPVWGGFLNPVLAALFFLGILPFFRRGASPFQRWALMGLALCWLPGLLTQDQESFRLFPMLPFLILGCLSGLQVLSQGLSSRGRSLLLLSLALPSLALDGYHLFGAYAKTWRDPADWTSYTRSLGRYRAYGILEGTRKEQGPGLVFPDFVQGLPDQSLAVATYDYNAILDPRLDPAQARWAAVLANANYQPFLKRRFPHGKAYALSGELATQDGGWMLFLFPTSDLPPGGPALWTGAQRALQSFLDEHLCFVMGGSNAKDIGALERLRSDFQGDPFLRSAYWEKMADLRIKGGPSDWPEAIQDLERAIREGYPAAHLYERSGVLHLLRGEKALARKDFEAAQRCPLDLTDSRSLIGSLDR